MITYKLIRYAHDNIEEEFISESDTIEQIENRALTDSKVKNNYYYTYRIDTYENDDWIGKCRYFTRGREFTQDLVRAIKDS